MEGLKQDEKRRRFTPPALLLLLPLLLVLPVLVLSWQHQFDGLYGQDAYAYYGYASGPLRQSLLALGPLPPFYWPPGYPLLVALTSFVTSKTPLAGQIVSLVAGALVVVLTGLLALELWTPQTFAPNEPTFPNRPQKIRKIGEISGKNNHRPLVAALIVALTPQLWQSSAVVMPDTTALASATCGVWALARYARVGRGPWLALASAAVAFAILVRLAYAPLALPCALFALWALSRRSRGKRLLHAVAGLSVALVILSPLLLSLLQTSDFLEKSDVLQADSSNDAPFLANLGDVPWNLSHAFQREFVTPSGRQQYALPNGIYYALSPTHRYYFTPLLAPFLLIGLWRLLKNHNPAQAFLLAAWPAAIYLSLVGYPFQNFRFTLGFLPPLAIIVAEGVQGVASNWHELARINERKKIRVNSRKFGAIFLIYLSLAGALLWMSYGGWTLSDSFMARKEGEMTTVRWVENQVQPESQLFTFAITLAFEQYSALQVYDLYGLEPAQIAALLAGEEAAAYLLVDTPNLEAQWAQHAPGRNYRWLEEKIGLAHLGRHRQYTLFRIEQDSDDGPP